MLLNLKDQKQKYFMLETEVMFYTLD
uniref:Uncharacterized protein n=1 Tax=Anguilla anguilla TaxID=7936 RepID=A0A0E9R0M7_ANGAN